MPLKNTTDLVRRQSGDQHWTYREPDRVKRGTSSHASKLSDEQIAEISAIIDERPTVNFSWLARKYGVSRITIWRHFKGRNESNVSRPLQFPPSFQVAAHEPSFSLPIPPDDAESIAERFWKHVEKIGECWVWTGGIDQDGYGRVRVGKQNRKAHRVAYQLAYGPFPPHLLIRHKCDNPPCCNPDHLLIGTHKDNADDRRKRGQTPSGDRHWTRRDQQS